MVCAEKIGSQQSDHASILLDDFENFSSKVGNAVERLVHHFSKAIQESCCIPEEEILSLKPALIACYLEFPFYQVTQYAGMQAIAENVASAKRVISLTLQSEVEHTQPLATRQECPLELLKATAVRTTSKQKVEETGKMFAYFAETLNLPFSSKIAFATETRDLRKGIFELNTVEANHNLSTFEDRFFEALFHYSSALDCLEACMVPCDPKWLTFKEITSSIFQAELLLKNFSCASSCTIGRNGKCLIIGWKGSPHPSLSVRKFQQY
ncbi:GRAS domain-containing protein [Citrus sinensis]|nr:GRAS domain-containing protein [Citrus sinensis]